MKITIRKPCFYSQKGMRDTQEDAVFPQNPTELSSYFIVCDGVGGCEHGEIASSLVCKAIDGVLANYVSSSKPMMPRIIKKALKAAFGILYSHKFRSREMATTLTLLSINSKGCVSVHLGDSRIYQIRKGKGIIFRTEDHSLVCELVKQNKITEQEAATHPQRNIITRCVCILDKEEDPMLATINEIYDIEPDDIFLLCSDGVYEEVDNNVITSLLSSDLPLEQKISKLAELTKNSSDNNTAYLVQVADVVRVPDDLKENDTYEIPIYPMSRNQLQIVSKIKLFLKNIWC